MLPIKFRFICISSFRDDFFFRNRPIRNKNCLWQPCLLADRFATSNLYRGPSIVASYQVQVHLAKRFQRRLICGKVTDDRRQGHNSGKNYRKMVIIQLDLDTSQIHLHTAPSFNLTFHSEVITWKPNIQLTNLGWSHDTHYNRTPSTKRQGPIMQ